MRLVLPILTVFQVDALRLFLLRWITFSSFTRSPGWAATSPACLLCGILGVLFRGDRCPNRISIRASAQTRNYAVTQTARYSADGSWSQQQAEK